MIMEIVRDMETVVNNETKRMYNSGKLTWNISLITLSYCVGSTEGSGNNFISGAGSNCSVGGIYGYSYGNGNNGGCFGHGCRYGDCYGSGDGYGHDVYN